MKNISYVLFIHFLDHTATQHLKNLNTLLGT